jgi:E3 ubiquitin-protein ligase KEG
MIIYIRPLHLCISTKNVNVVKKWVEMATPEEKKVALEIPSSTGTALCMAAALKKAHESGKT